MNLQTLIKEVYVAEILDRLDLDNIISFNSHLKIGQRYRVLYLTDHSESIHHYDMIDPWDLISIRNY